VGAAIGQSLPVAVGVLISPLPIVAVVLMLVSPGGRANALAFLLGWIVAGVVFAVVASLGVAAPVVIDLSMGERAATLLDELKDWMTRHDAVIMAVLLLVLGAKMIGDGISGL